MRAYPTGCRMLCSLLFLRAVTFSFAQTTGPQTLSNATVLTVTVVSHDHRLVTDLKAENFAVLEEGQSRAVLSATAADVPACIGLLADSSGSMHGKSGAIASAVAGFVRSGNPENQFFVVNFNDTAHLYQNFTNSPTLIERALALADAHGGTAVLDTLVVAAEHLAKNPACKKRVLVLISDGGDNASHITGQQTTNAVRNTGNPLVYSMVLPEEGGLSHRAARHIVEALASASGGESFHLHNTKDLAQALAKLGEELRSQYTLTYSTPNAAGRQGGVKVVVRSHGDKKLTGRVNVAGAEGPKPASGQQQ